MFHLWDTFCSQEKLAPPPNPAKRENAGNVPSSPSFPSNLCHPERGRPSASAGVRVEGPRVCSPQSCRFREFFLTNSLAPALNFNLTGVPFDKLRAGSRPRRLIRQRTSSLEMTGLGRRSRGNTASPRGDRSVTAFRPPFAQPAKGGAPSCFSCGIYFCCTGKGWPPAP